MVPESALEITIDALASGAGHIVELIGIAVLILGALVASAAFVLRLLRGASFDDAYLRCSGNEGGNQ